MAEKATFPVIALTQSVLNVAKKAILPINVLANLRDQYLYGSLANLVAKLFWMVILNAQNAVKKIIYLVTVPNVSVVRKKETLKETVLRFKPLPLSEMETVSILMNRRK